MKILTEADSFDASVTVPEGGDARTAGSVETPMQALTNRHRYTYNRMQAAAIRILAQSTAILEQPLPLQLVGQLGSGFAVDGSTYQITVPAAGTYFATVALDVAAAATTANIRVGVKLGLVSGGTTTEMVLAKAMRASANPADYVSLYGSGIVTITDAATQRLRLVGIYGVGALTTYANNPGDVITLRRAW